MSRFESLRCLFVVSCFGLMSVACTRVKVEEVRGPDGGEWKAISCSRVNKKCFDAADRMCPGGYVFARAGQTGRVSSATTSTTSEAQVTTLPPREEWRDGMYSKKPGKLFVRCATEPKVAQRASSTN